VLFNKEHFVAEENGGVYLTADGKRLLFQAFYDKLDTSVTVAEGSRSYHWILSEEVRKLVRHFRGEVPYKAFRQVR